MTDAPRRVVHPPRSPRKGVRVSAEENTRLVQSAYEAFGQGDMAAFAEVMADDIEWVDRRSRRRPERRNLQRQGSSPRLGWWSCIDSRLHDVRATRVHRPERQGGIPGVLRGDGSGHRPRVCQPGGTRVDDPGWKTRPIPE